MSEQITPELLAGLVWDTAKYAAIEGGRGRSPVEVADECAARWEAVHAKVTEWRQPS